MNLAVVSVAALEVAVFVSCVTPLNVGVLALAMAWIVGVYIGHMPINAVIAGFPTPLFLTLVGVTLLFALASARADGSPIGVEILDEPVADALPAACRERVPRVIAENESLLDASDAEYCQ